MALTDTEGRIREAIVTIAGSNTALTTLLGRATDVVRERSNPGGAALPARCLVYGFEDFDEGTGRGTLRLTAGVDDAANNAQTARELLRAAVDGFTAPAFEAFGLPVLPLAEARAAPEDDRTVALVRDGQPMLAQAETVLPLLYLL